MKQTEYIITTATETIRVWAFHFTQARHKATLRLGHDRFEVRQA